MLQYQNRLCYVVDYFQFQISRLTWNFVPKHLGASDEYPELVKHGHNIALMVDLVMPCHDLVHFISYQVHFKSSNKYFGC